MDNDRLIEIIELINKRYTEKFVKEAFTLLLLLFKNIINKPGEDKFRILNLKNNNIKNKVLIIKETIDLVESIGYYDSGKDTMRFDGSPQTLTEVVGMLNMYIEELDKKLKKIAQEEEKMMQELKESNERAINKQKVEGANSIKIVE